jgi:hypothetical protein
MQNAGLIVSILNVLVLALLSLRFFRFATKMERYMRAQTALMSLITRHQGQKPNANADVDVFRIISENDLIEELPLRRETPAPEPDEVV